MEGQAYPTVAMLEVMNKLAALEKQKPSDKKAIEEFKKRYVIKTALKEEQGLHMIVTLFKIHTQDVRDNDYREKLVELEGLVIMLKEPIDVIGAFYCQIVDNYIAGRYVFYGLLGDGKTSIPFDLKEGEDDFRLITTKECGGCKKTVDLEVCTKCHKAAYCNRECQKKDFKFHKHFCAYLGSAATTATPKQTNK